MQKASCNLICRRAANPWFSGMLPQPAGWDTCMPHAMHYQYHIGRYADAQTCTETRYGPVYDAKRVPPVPPPSITKSPL